MLKALGRLVTRADRRLGSDVYYAQRLARRVSGRVASGPRRGKVLLAGVLLGTRRWKRPITLRLDTPVGPVPFTIPDYEAFKVLDEMFYRREYDLDLATPPETILDLGGHVGASALFFRRKWPDARIVAVEANPRLVEMLRTNTNALNIDVRHGAVAGAEGSVQFVEGPASWSGTTEPGAGENAVAAITLDSLLDKPVDLVKLDVEGGEFDALPAARLLGNAAVIVGEIHAEPNDASTRDLLAAFDGFAVSTEGDGSGHTLFRAVRK